MFQEKRLRIVWAVDGFSGDPDLFSKSHLLLERLSSLIQVEVEPVFVLAPDPLDVSVDFKKSLIAVKQQQAENAMSEMFSKCAKNRSSRSPRMLSPQVLVDFSHYGRISVGVLCDYARRSGSDLVLVGTHARGSYSQNVLGGFVESLIRECSVPVLAVSPKTQIDTSFKQIIFPVDLECYSKTAFQMVLMWCRLLGAELVLYSRLGDGPRAQETQEAEKKGAQLLDEAAENGVKASLHLDEYSPQPLSDSILNFARAQGGQSWIASRTNLTQVQPVLRESVTRKLIEESDHPMWVLPAADAS